MGEEEKGRIGGGGNRDEGGIREKEESGKQGREG